MPGAIDFIAGYDAGWKAVLGWFAEHTDAHGDSYEKPSSAIQQEDPMSAPSVPWFEVTGKDGPALQSFYGELFDWKIQDAGDDSGYGLVKAGEEGIGGGIGRAPDGGSGQVTFYVEVDDPAAYLQKAEQLGGQTIVPPTTREQFGLTFAFFADPEGHIIGLSQGAVQ